MKKILGLALGLSFVFGTLAMAQDSSKDANAGSGSTTKSSKKHHSKKSKSGSSDKMSGDSSTPKQ
jgi:hypothetical protein